MMEVAEISGRYTVQQTILLSTVLICTSLPQPITPASETPYLKFSKPASLYFLIKDTALFQKITH